MFAENLYYLRKRDKITQEELADDLGVSRQSVSKWETGEAYPETDKLVALCDKFGVSLDELMRGDLTVERKTTGGEEFEVFPDEHGYERHMDLFSRLIAAGVFLVMFGVAVCVALGGVSVAIGGKNGELIAVMGGVAVLLFAAAAVFLFVYSGMAHERFTRANPTVKNVFAKERLERFFKRFPLVMALLVSAIILDVVFLVVFFALLDAGLIGGSEDVAGCVIVAVFLLVLSFLVSGLTYEGIQHTKFKVSEYNEQTERELNPTPRKKVADAVCGAVMMVATAVFLVQGFVWNLWHPGWVVFPVGGIICAVISTLVNR